MTQSPRHKGNKEGEQNSLQSFNLALVSNNSLNGNNSKAVYKKYSPKLAWCGQILRNKSTALSCHLSEVDSSISKARNNGISVGVSIANCWSYEKHQKSGPFPWSRHNESVTAAAANL